MITCSDFDWSDPESVTVAEQLAIAVYPNPKGVVVIRQEGTWDSDGDTVIFVNPQHAKVIAAAILEVAGDVGDDEEDEATEPLLISGPRSPPRQTDNRAPQAATPSAPGQSPAPREAQGDLLGGKKA